VKKKDAAFLSFSFSLPYFEASKVPIFVAVRFASNFGSIDGM
jgi:hypothetical protein